jgi:hypothetical protein
MDEMMVVCRRQGGQLTRTAQRGSSKKTAEKSQKKEAGIDFGAKGAK